VSRLGDGRVRCGLCGRVFEPHSLACHDGCPLGPTCRLICCPNCGYEVPDESRVVGARLFARLRRREQPVRHDVEALPLSAVRDGGTALVRSLDGMPGPRSARLSALGIVPGVPITLRQRRPVPVVRVGLTDIALSDEILEQILVADEPDVASRRSTRRATAPTREDAGSRAAARRTAR
jgi:Fe2+ transport system protein FeoA